MQKKCQKKFPQHEYSNQFDSLQKNKSKTINQSETSKFTKYQIVWAKISGYPWWPAIITTIPDEKDNSQIKRDFKNGNYFSKMNANSSIGFRVDFIADQTHAYLKKNFLLKYSLNRQRLYIEGLQFSRRKRQFFQMAINQADQLYQVLQISKNQANKIQKEQIQKEQSSSSSEQSSSQQSQNSSSSEQQQIEKNNIARKIKQGNRKKNKNKQYFGSISLKQKAQEVQQGFPGIKRKRGRPAKKIRNNLQNLFGNKRNELIKNEQIFNKQLKQIQRQIQIEELSQQKLQAFFQEQQSEQQKLSNRKQIQSYQLKRKQTQIMIDEKTNSNINFHQNKQQKQLLMSKLLSKYKLDQVEEHQQQYKSKIKQSNKFQQIAILNNSGSLQNKKINGSRSMIFIKNILTLTNKKKNGKKNKQSNRVLTDEESMFIQSVAALGKLKDFQCEEISIQKKQFLIAYCKKWITRKIYSIIQSIIKRNSHQTPDQTALKFIREICFKISCQLFNDEEFQKLNTQEKAVQQRKNSGNAKKKNNNKSEKLNFLILFKRKLQQSVKFLRLYCLQNWQLLIKTGNFSTELCILMKGFEQFLQNQCGLTLKNQDKFEDIIKQIGIENEKTSFICPSNLNQIQNQNSSLVLNRKMSDQKIQQINRPSFEIIETK